MAWELEEAISYYRSQGAPRDQMALVNLLKEISREQGLTPGIVSQVARAYQVKDSFLLAIISRYPSLRLQDQHCLEVCCGPNCGRKSDLLTYAEKTYGGRKDLQIRSSGCMRLCGKGPNIRWDGQVYHHADEKLVDSLLGTKK